MLFVQEWGKLFSQDPQVSSLSNTLLMCNKIIMTCRLWVCFVLCQEDRNACTRHPFMCLCRFHSMSHWRYATMPSYSLKNWKILLWLELFSSLLCTTLSIFHTQWKIRGEKNCKWQWAGIILTGAWYSQIHLLALLQTCQHVTLRFPREKEWTFQLY